MKTIYIVSERSNGNFVAEFDSREDAERDICEWGRKATTSSPKTLKLAH